MGIEHAKKVISSNLPANYKVKKTRKLAVMVQELCTGISGGSRFLRQGGPMCNQVGFLQMDLYKWQE